MPVIHRGRTYAGEPRQNRGMDWTDVAVALLLGAACAACERPGRPWCPECAARLETAASPRLLPGEPPTLAVCDYGGVVPEAIVGYKDRGIRALTRPLSALVALGVLELAETGRSGLLVPVPSSPSAVRRRGAEHVWELTRRAGEMVGAPAARLLRSRHRRDQAGLSDAGRTANLSGRIRVRDEGVGSAIVIDDVTTSGATLGECDRALQAGGYDVVGHVVIAAARHG